MSIKKRLLRGGFWAAGGKLFTILAAFLINVLLARLLAPTDIGIYFLAASVVNALAIIGLMGTNRLVVRLIAEQLATSANGIRSITVKAITLSGIGLTCIAVIYWFVIQPWLSTAVPHARQISGFGALMVLWLLLWGAQTFISESLRGFHDIRGSAVFGGMLYNAFLLAGLAIAWLVGAAVGLQVVLVLIILALSVNFIGGIRILWWRVRTASDGDAVLYTGSIMGPALYLMVTSMSLLLISDVHLWIVSYYCDETEVARYGAALRLVNLLIVPLTVINLLITSSIADLFAQKKLAKLQWLMSAGATAAAVPSVAALGLAMLWSEGLLRVVFGEQYQAASVILVVMAMGHVVNLATGLPGALLMMSGREKRIMQFSVGSALVGVALSMFLTPSLGAVGAAYGTATTIIIHNVSMWSYARRKLGVDTRVNFASMRDLYQKARIYAESSIADKSAIAAAERYWRVLEGLLWTLRGFRIIDCFGDSHARVFRLLNGRSEIQNVRFRVVAVRGATMFGLGNPNSKTNALNVFTSWLADIPSSRTVLFLLGEVDVGFLIWWRAKKYGLDPSAALDEAVHRYWTFLENVIQRHPRLIVVSAPLPTIPDDFTEGEVANARGDIDVSQYVRTQATLKFNAQMKDWCEERNIRFVDLDQHSLDKSTGLVRADLLNEDAKDHHYDQRAFADLLARAFISTENQ